MRKTKLRFSKNELNMGGWFFSVCLEPAQLSFGPFPLSNLLKIPLNEVLLSIDMPIIKIILIITSMYTFMINEKK